MTRLAGLATAGVALLVALACSPTTTAHDTPEPTMSHTETPEPPPDPSTPPSTPAGTEAKSGIIRDVLAVTLVVERYIRAIAARNEAEAAQFTCRQTDGGLLWVSSVGRPITLRRVTRIDLETLGKPVAEVVILVEGQPESRLNLEKRDGRWCVWP